MPRAAQLGIGATSYLVGVMITYSNATVTFSDGHSETFTQAVAHDNGFLVATRTRSFSLFAPKGLSAHELRLKGGPGTVTDTVTYAPHAWVKIVEPPVTALCVAISRPDSSADVVNVKDEIDQRSDVPQLIRDFLKANVGSDQFQAFDSDDKPAGGLNSVPPSRTRALDARYIISAPGSTENRSEARFWLADNAQNIEAEFS